MFLSNMKQPYHSEDDVFELNIYTQSSVSEKRVHVALIDLTRCK